MIYGDRPIKIHLIRALETKCGNLLEVQLAQHKHCWCLYMCTYLFHTLKLLHPHKTTPSNQVLGVQAETWWWLIDLLWLQIIEAEFSDSYWIKEDGFGYLCLLNKLTHKSLLQWSNYTSSANSYCLSLSQRMDHMLGYCWQDIYVMFESLRNSLVFSVFKALTKSSGC